MKRIKRISELAMIALLAGVVSAEAHNTTVSGRRVQEDHHEVALGYNEAERVRIVNGPNGSRGFDVFLAYIAGDADGKEVILDAAYRKGSDCTGDGCVFYLTNTRKTVLATELTVIGAVLRGIGTADVIHCSSLAMPPC